MFIFLLLYNMFKQTVRNCKKKKSQLPIFRRLREQRNVINNSRGCNQQNVDSGKLKDKLSDFFNKYISREKKRKRKMPFYRDSL